jgi:hypothetical protein
LRKDPIPRRIVESVECDSTSPRSVAREFRSLLDAGARFHVSGRARRNPEQLLRLGYTPKHKLELFGTRFYLSNVRQNPELRFYVAYVVQPRARGAGEDVFARIFYKDLSLVWRVASHLSYDVDGSLWIGKGDVQSYVEGGEEMEASVESTTDLPLEMQTALESRLRAIRRVPGDGRVLEQVLRRAPADRIAPYADFTRPRERAWADPRNRIHGGRKIARFRRRRDPSSLEFVKGFEPDFKRGIIECAEGRSQLYGGRLQRFRILSRNRQIQYLFIAGPRHVWIVPPQATTTELSSFGVRTIDVHADDDLFVPGFEYHYMDEELDPPALYSQIPKGFAGGPCLHDEHKADASPWLDRLPVVRAFRRQVLGERVR